MPCPRRIHYGPAFNINIFDSAVFHKTASDLDIVRGCMAVWLESYTNNADGTPKKLPGVQDLRAWEDRFGDAFGGNYKGKSIVDVVYGRTRKNITKLLPDPDPQAFHTTPPQELFPELGGELAAGIKKRQRDWTEKPDDHAPERRQAPALKLTDRSNLQMARPAPTEEQEKYLSTLPVHRQPGSMRAQTVAAAASFRQSRRAHHAQK